jgi:dTDP-glucose pyrophosphorylase
VITRAVLLAAGRGARLGELTRRFPKAMLQVGGQPILHRIIAALASEGVSEITIVTGHEAAALERATGAGETWGTRIRYRRQRELNGTAGAVSLARDHLGDAPFFCGWGDIVVDAANYGRVLSAASGGDGALAVNEVDDPAAGAAVYVDDRGYVTRIVEKPAPGTSATHWNNAGLAVLPAAIWKYIDVLEVSPRGELELPQAIAAFVAEGGRLKAVPIQGKWFDVGTPENFEAARRHFGV